MEELDYEDVLLIHPDEDIKKIEPIETYANSSLEWALETDANSNLEQTIEIDANSNLEQAIEGDTNSSLEGAIETDDNSNLERAIETDDNSNLERAIETGDNSNLEQAIETNANSKLEQVSDSDSGQIEDERASASDSGEIDDDEEANDLEEGEIKESGTVLKKKSDIACRFFKRGSCAFGSQCQYLHVSDTVYKMFDTNPQRRNDLLPVEHHNFLKPIIFPTIVLPPRPFIEPLISVAQKPEFHRKCDTLEDNWEKGLEQARILIRKANIKRKNEENEPNVFNSKNNKGEKVKGQYFTKTNLGNELLLANSKKYCEKAFTNNSSRRVDACDEKKSNYRYQPRSSDKWVDPWRRSKSPDSKSRQRSRSGSPPSRSRKHSYASSTSSTSSSSSEFDGGIYERPYKRKSSIGRRVSKSRSISQSRQPKKRRISPKHAFNGRRKSRSSSRSFSRSPNRKRNSGSRSRSSSSSSSLSCSDREMSPTPEDKEMQRISAKLSEQYRRKSPNRASSLLRSDCETSELTVSSASCTTFSSGSETESSRHSPSLKRKQSPNQNNTSSYSNKSTSLANPKVFNRKESNLLRSGDGMQRKDDVVPAFHKKIQPYNSGRNQNNWNLNTESTDRKPKNTTSYFNSVKKPAASEFSKNKRSDDMNLLCMYQDLRNSNNMQNPTKVKPNNPPLKPNKTDNAVKVANKANSNSGTHNKISKVRNVSSHDMDMLFIYQGLGNANKSSKDIQNVKPSNPASKPNKTDDAVKVADRDNSYSESYHRMSNIRNVTKQNIVLNLQPKSKDNFKPEIINKPQDMDETVTIKKAAASKREKLLNKLKLIDDAIAKRKKTK